MAAPPFNSTMAAGSKPFLRESVNAVRGADHWSVTIAAKVGNAISKSLRPIASRYYPSLTGDVEAVAGANGARGGGLGNGTGHLTRSDIAHREVGF